VEIIPTWLLTIAATGMGGALVAFVKISVQLATIESKVDSARDVQLNHESRLTELEQHGGQVAARALEAETRLEERLQKLETNGCSWRHPRGC